MRIMMAGEFHDAASSGFLTSPLRFVHSTLSRDPDQSDQLGVMTFTLCGHPSTLFAGIVDWLQFAKLRVQHWRHHRARLGLICLSCKSRGPITAQN
jgi:hypothetical protein